MPKISSRWQSRKTCAHPFLREHKNYNKLLNKHWWINVITYQKRYPTLPRKEKPYDGRKATKMIESNSIPAEWATHNLESNYTTEVVPLQWRFWAPSLEYTKTQGKRAVTPKVSGSALPAGVQGYPAEERVCLGLNVGQRLWQQQFWEVLIGVSPSKGYH